MDSIVTLLIFAALALISGWLKRRQRKDDEFDTLGQDTAEAEAQPPGGPTRPRSQWEDELRRMLGETPSAPPSLPSAPPPLPAEPARSWIEVPPPVTYSDESSGPSPLLIRATQSQQRGLDLERRVAQQLHRGSGAPLRAQPLLPSHAQATARQAMQLLRQPQSIRAALICSIILAPPKAFAEESKL